MEDQNIPNLPAMSDEELSDAIQTARSHRNFARLSVQLVEISLQRVESMITAGLQGFEEHAPEPGPNPNSFIGYYKYDKDAYVQAYERLKPMRDLVRLLNDFLPNMRVVRDNHQARFTALIRHHEVRQLRARFQAQLLRNANAGENHVEEVAGNDGGIGNNDGNDAVANDAAGPINNDGEAVEGRNERAFYPHPDGGLDCENYEY